MWRVFGHGCALRDAWTYVPFGTTRSFSGPKPGRATPTPVDFSAAALALFAVFELGIVELKRPSMTGNRGRFSSNSCVPTGTSCVTRLHHHSTSFELDRAPTLRVPGDRGGEQFSTKRGKLPAHSSRRALQAERGVAFRTLRDRIGAPRRLPGA